MELGAIPVGGWLADSPRARVELKQSSNKQVSELGNHCGRLWGYDLLVKGDLNNRLGAEGGERQGRNIWELGFLNHVQNGREMPKAKAGDGIAPQK